MIELRNLYCISIFINNRTCWTREHGIMRSTVQLQFYTQSIQSLIKCFHMLKLFLLFNFIVISEFLFTILCNFSHFEHPIYLWSIKVHLFIKLRIQEFENKDYISSAAESMITCMST